MKILKSIFAGALSLLLCTCHTKIIGATTICGDVNNDGIVGISDISYLSMYLKGNYYGVNINNSYIGS